MKKKSNVGIIGCGTIGAHLAVVCAKKLSKHVSLTCVAEHNEEKVRTLSKKIGLPLKLVSIPELIRRSDFIIEAANPAVAAVSVKLASSTNKTLLIMSVGALGLLPKTVLGKIRGRLFCPSGAVAGIDALSAAALGKLKEVSLVTRKPPKSLEGAPFFAKNPLPRFRSKKQELCVFRGTTRSAVRAFPNNINVSMVLALAGLGASKTRVEIWTSPSYEKNTHEVRARGDFGTLLTRTENVPSATNPKTSALALLSAEATLLKAFSSVKIGT